MTFPNWHKVMGKNFEALLEYNSPKKVSEKYGNSPTAKVREEF